MRFANEIKVGVVTLLGLGLILFGYFFLRGLGLSSQFYYLKLDGAAQIAQGNEVRLQGVKIGQVQEVGFDPTDQKPILTLAVRRSNPPFKLLKTYKYVVQGSGIIGENYVDIGGEYSPTAGVYEPNSPGQVIPGQASGGILDVAQSAEPLIAELRLAVREFRQTNEVLQKGVLNTQNQRELSRAVRNVAQLTGDASRAISAVSGAANRAVGPDGVRVDLGDPNARRNLARTLENVESASNSAAAAARNIELAARDAQALSGTARRELGALLSENRGQVRSLVVNFDRAAKNVAGVTETLDFALRQGGFSENTAIAFQSIRRAAENIEVATTGFRRLGEDPNTSAGITASLSALRESTEALRDTARSVRSLVIDDATQASRLSGAVNNLNAAAENLAAGTVGLKNIVGDQEFQADIKASADNLNATLAATRGAAERVNSLLGGRRPRDTQTGQSSSPANPSSGANAFRTDGASFTLRRLNNRSGPDGGQTFGDVAFGTELFGAPFRAGIANIGDGNDLTLQSGRFLSDNIALRYGLYRSKLGAGLELRQGRFSLESNLWDLNDTSYNVYGGFSLTPNLDVLAGRESFDGQGTTSIGVRIRP